MRSHRILIISKNLNKIKLTLEIPGGHRPNPVITNIGEIVYVS